MMDVMERVYRRVLLLARAGVGNLVKDGGHTQTLQVVLGTGEVLDDVTRITEYGFQSVPPAGHDMVALFLGGNPADGVIISTQHRQYRMQGMATGEVSISDDKGQRVFLSAAGIRIEGGTLPMQINASAGLTINANTVFHGTVMANGHRIDEAHKHTGGTISGLTGVVT